MEIKTCEQYVLSRLQELESENDNLKDNLEALEKDFEEQEKKLSMLEILFRKYAKIRSFGETLKNYYIKIEDIDGWRKECKADYDFIVNTFGLVEEEEENAGISDKVQTENVG